MADQTPDYAKLTLSSQKHVDFSFGLQDLFPNLDEEALASLFEAFPDLQRLEERKK